MNSFLSRLFPLLPQTVFVRVINNLHITRIQSKFTVLIIVNLLAAFETLFFKKLLLQLVFQDKVFSWFYSYSMGPTFSVSSDGFSLASKPVLMSLIFASIHSLGGNFQFYGYKSTHV